MSGGHFDYQQYRINDIADSIERVIETHAKPKPPTVIRKWVSLKIRTGESSYSHNYSYLSQRLYRCESLKEAQAILKTEPHLYMRNGRFFSHYDMWNDKKGNTHPYEYILTEQESEEYEEGHEEDCNYYYDFTPETIQEFRNGIQVLHKASIYAQRIDWLLSGDDGEDSFHKRLKEELEHFEKNGTL